MNNCGRCGEQVYFAEQKLAIGKVWHSFCFSCCRCHKLLDSCSVCPYNSELYCPACYRGVSSTPNLPSCFRSKPSSCNPCIPFKPRQLSRNCHEKTLKPPLAESCCSRRHFREETPVKPSGNCAYCNCFQCYCDCCKEGSNIGLQQDQQGVEEVEEVDHNCSSHRSQFKAPARNCEGRNYSCHCGNCNKISSPEVPHFPRLYCLSRQTKHRLEHRKPQQPQEVHRNQEHCNHCCFCERCGHNY